MRGLIASMLLWAASTGTAAVVLMAGQTALGTLDSVVTRGQLPLGDPLDGAAAAYLGSVALGAIVGAVQWWRHRDVLHVPAPPSTNGTPR